MDYPEVKIEGMQIIENTYTDGYAEWNVLKLIEHSKQYRIFDLPLAGIDMSISAWGGDALCIDHFIFHCKRVERTNLEYPILLNNQGQICDGWHRVVKAVLNGDKTIKAIRFETMPEPDKYIEK